MGSRGLIILAPQPGHAISSCDLMRPGRAYEHVALLLAVLVVSFCCGDEEPLWEFTDFNFLHVWLIAASFMIVMAEAATRSAAGAYVYKDFVSLLALLSFWLSIENYTRLALIVLNVQSLMPVELDLLDAAEVLSYRVVVAAIEGLFMVAGLIYLTPLAAILGYSLGWKKQSTQSLLCALFCAGLAVFISLGLWDLLMAGLSSFFGWESREVFYLQAHSGWTYDRTSGLGDQFDWHRERVWPYSLWFEDLYSFYLHLLLLWDICCCFVVWAYLFLTTGVWAGGSLTYTKLGVGLFWLEHLLWAVVIYVGYPHLALVRLWGRVPLEWGLWF